MSLPSVVRRLSSLAMILAAIETDLPGQGVATFSYASSYLGAYFGTFENGGHWGMVVSWDNLARFDFIGRAGNGFAVRSYPYPSEFFDGGEFVGSMPANGEIAGSIANGVVIGAAAGYAFQGKIDRAEGSGSAYRGYYRWSDGRQPSATMTSVEVIVGSSGNTIVLLKTPYDGDEDGMTTITADGTFAVTLSGGTRVSARIDPGTAKLEATVSRAGAPLPREGRVINFSTLGFGTEGASRFGFTVAGGEGKHVLFRAVGSQLSTILGSDSYMEDPVIEVGKGTARIALNDDWDADDPELRRAMAQTGAFALVAGSKDAAVIATLSPGNYWLNVHSANSESTGKVLVEIFDLEPNNGSLLNLAVQGFVGHGPDTLISGFVISGAQPRSVLVRAVGPGSAPPGAYNPDPLTDPQLEVRNSAGIVVAANDNWSSLDSPLLAATRNAGTFRLDPGSSNAALLVTLAPGAYTASVRGAGGTTGNVLVEIYDSEIVPPATKARLVVDVFTATMTRHSDRIYYQPQLRLTEIGGISSATVTMIKFKLEDVGAAGDIPPWLLPKTVAAGGSREMIEVVDAYGDRELDIDATVAAEILSVVITYRDSEGREDSISALARVTR